jgi:hypothetical protein
VDATSDCLWVEKRREEKWESFFTFWWLIWKERNKRIVEQKESSAQGLAVLIHDTIHLHQFAWAPSVTGYCPPVCSLLQHPSYPAVMVSAPALFPLLLSCIDRAVTTSSSVLLVWSLVAVRLACVAA